MAQASGSVNRIFLAQFRPDSTNKFVSVGVRHVRFWTLAGSKLLSKRGSFISYSGKQKMQTMLSLAFAPVSLTDLTDLTDLSDLSDELPTTSMIVTILAAPLHL